MRRWIVVIPATLALAACMPGAATPSASVPDEPLPKPIANPCKSEPAQRHVGATASQQTGAAILADSGAATLRWGPPETAWTMDYREDRVNVRYDAQMTITAVTCG